MGAPIISTTLSDADGSVMSDRFDDKIEAIRAILRTYIPGVSNVLKGIRPPGDEEIPFPCFMVGAGGVRATMRSTAKYDTRWTVDVFWMVGDSNPEAAEQKGTNILMLLRKLFSNNASTITGAGYGNGPYGQDPYGDPWPSAAANSFRQYLPYWVDSEQTKNDKSPLFKSFGDGPKYTVVGHFSLTLQTWELISQAQ